MKAAVIGSGAWGTALAVALAKNGHQVTLIEKNEKLYNIYRIIIGDRN